MLFSNLTPVVPAGDGLRFTLGEIDHTRPDGVHIRADVFVRGDGRASWSARVTTPPVDGDSHGAPGCVEAAGPHLVDDEATAEAAALDWIRGRL